MSSTTTERSAENGVHGLARRVLKGSSYSIMQSTTDHHEEARATSSGNGVQAGPSRAFDVDDAVERIAQALQATAIERDADGGVPKRERDLLRQSGLLSLVVPTELGGLGQDWSTTLRAVRRIAEVDGSMAHVFGFQHLLLATLRLFGDSGQYAPLLRRTVERAHFWGNALNPLDTRTSIEPRGGDFIVNGKKSFCSGAGDSDMLVLSATNARGALVVAAIPTRRDGVVIVGDWDNMGQRQTDSGTVEFHGVPIEKGEILSSPGPLGTPFASLRPLIAQLTLANVYLGIARGALDEAKRFTRSRGKPWFAARVESALRDPYVLHHYGEFFVELEAARLLADHAASELDAAWKRGESLLAEQRGACAVVVATAKVKAARAGLDVVHRVFEVTGARATARSEGLDRFWRNLRTHSLHDPVDYKLCELGEWVLREELPTPTFYS